MADAIWNNNYLLSNLDAQKLYAQSPLTTGVSGTSAYIGLEPSARYNETVLWSGSNFVESGTTAYLSDNIQNYEELKVCYNPIYTKGYEVMFDVPSSANSYRFGVFSQDTSVYQTVVSLQINGNAFYIQRVRGLTFNTSNTTWAVRAVVPTGAMAEGIYKLVGVNKKEV